MATRSTTASNDSASSTFGIMPPEMVPSSMRARAVAVVNVDSRAKAKAFSDGDPFTKNGVFSEIKITRMRKGQWNPAAAEGA